MANEKLSIEELIAKQGSLQDAHDKAQQSFQGARKRYAKAKQGLVDFNQKYGRMLKLVVVDPDAEEPAAEEAEEVTLTADDVATVTAEEIVNDPPVDTSAEE